VRERGLRGGDAGDRHAERRAAHVVQAGGREEADAQAPDAPEWPRIYFEFVDNTFGAH